VEANANPMAFFGAKKPASADGAAAPQAAAPPQEAPPAQAPKTGGINWQDLVDQATQAEAPAAAVPPSAPSSAPSSAVPPAAPDKAAAPAQRLDPETARILQQAGKDTRQALEGRKTDTDAAE
jgi:hypothetical protein